MARPRRFAPTAGRFGVPSGVRVVDAGEVPPGVRVVDANAPLPRGVRVVDAAPQVGVDWRAGAFGNRPWLQTDSRGRFAGLYKRPLSVLGGVFRVLGVGENVAVGTLRGAAEDVGTFLDAPTYEKAIAAVSPWLWIAAHAPDNFTEVKDAVEQNKTYEQWIRETQEPNSFLYENAFVIGLGLSIFGDPTTYLTFGSTAGSKVAGQKLLAASYMSTADEASEALLTGVIKRTGEDVAEYGYDFDRVFHRIHTESARPYTVGDSLTRIRDADKGRLPDVDDRWLNAMGIKPRGPIRRTMRSAFARGGQGVRFMGAEIPGSRRIAPAFGRAAAATPGVPDRASMIEAFKHVIPDAKLKMLTEDATRAVAMSEFTRANQAMAMAQSGAFQDALEHFAIDPVRARAATAAPYKMRAAVAIRNIFNEVPLAVPKADRMDLFKAGHRPTGKFGSTLKDMRTKAYKTRDEVIGEAEAMGFSEAQLDHLRASWDEHVRTLRDPVDVLARWQATAVGLMAKQNVIETILANPLLARPVLEGADDLARIEGDMAELNEKILRATAKFNEKGLSKRAKQARFQLLQDLQSKSAVLASNWNVVKGRISEQKAGVEVFEQQPIANDLAVKQLEDIFGKDPQAIGFQGSFEDVQRALKAKGTPFEGPAAANLESMGNADDYGDMIVTAWRLAGRTDAMDEADDYALYQKFDEAVLDAEPKTMRELMEIAAEVTGRTTTKRSVERAGVKVGGLFDEDAARATFHENAVPYRFKGKKYWVPAPIAQALDEMKNPQLIDKELKKWFRAMNFTQNKWKILATSLNPRFHVMNMVGGMWNNMLGGVYNPGDYAEQYTSMLRQRIGRMDDESAMGRMLGPVRERIDPDKLARDRDLLDAYEGRHAGGGFIAHETHPEYQEMKRQARLRSTKGRVFTAARRAYAGTVIPLTVAPDEWVPDEIEDSPLFNPLAGLAAGLPELSRAGRYLANDVETVLRETPMRVAMKDPSYYQLMDAYSLAPPVNFGRWMGETDIGRTQMGKELVWDIGAAMALRYQFDYSNLTHFERYFAKTIFPFYTFNKNNFVLQVQELAQRPRFLAVTSDVMNFSQQMTATEENEGFQAILPEYFDKLSMFRVPVPDVMREAMGLPQDQDLYLNPTLPFASLNLFPAFWQVAQDDSLTPTNHRWLQMFAPFFGLVGPNAVFPMAKPMFEYSIGYNLGLARPIDYQQLQSGGWRSSYREAPNFMKYLPKQLQQTFGIYKDPGTGILMQEASMAYISEQMASPFINASGDIFNWGQGGVEADRVRANNFAFITGIRLTPVDPLRLQRSFLYRAENFLEGRKADAKRRGVEFPMADQRLLTQIRAQLKGVETEWDRKQEALYKDG